jgi:predicted O-methyltransferase YrrM
MEPCDGSLAEMMDRANRDPALGEIRAKFAGSGILSWVTEVEQSLLFGLGAYGPGHGTIVEVGSFQGGSACFIAAGIARRGQGRLTCIDPFLGAPPWLGTAPHQRTLEAFRRGTKLCGIDDLIDARIGDSHAVSAVWPATPIDAVFIDGDHSFVGALRDLECWAPKLSAGGLMLIDNADDPGVPEVKELTDLIRTFRSFQFLGSIGIAGIAVFRRTEVPAWEMLEEVTDACKARGIYRPWDLSALHRVDLPGNYLKSKDWSDGGMDEAYQLGFLGRCGRGDYGYTAASNPSDRALLRALSKDREDGRVLEVGGLGDKIRSVLRQPNSRFRVLLCAPEEVGTYAPSLLPGGLMLARIAPNSDHPAIQAGLNLFHDANLTGSSILHNSILFGVWQPYRLTSDTIVEHAMKPDGPSGARDRILAKAS